MTEKEKINAVDVVLIKLYPNDPRLWNQEDLRCWLNEENIDNVFDNLIAEYDEAVFNKIHGFLIEEKYLGTIPISGFEYLTPEGIKAKELKGHINYLAWKQKEDKKKRKIEWPQQNWYWVAIITFGLGLLVDLIKPSPTSKSESNSIIVLPQLKKPIETIHDTIYIVDSLHKGH